LAGRYDNPIPTWFLAPIDCLKISAQSNLVPKTLYADSLKRFLTLRGKCRILDHEVFDLGVWWFPREMRIHNHETAHGFANMRYWPFVSKTVEMLISCNYEFW
jgi:hypothetical protein